MEIKTFGSRNFDCARAIEPCSRVLLINTSFVCNTANYSGSAILTTTPKNVLVACKVSQYFSYTKLVQAGTIEWLQRKWQLDMIGKSFSLCKAWRHNRLASGAYDQVIGTFGQTINITTNSTDGSKILGDSKFGFALYNVASGKDLPMIKVTTIDAFGNEYAPTLHYDALVLSNNDGFLKRSIGLSFENGTCIVTNIIGFVEPRKYSLQLKPRYDDDILEATNLTIVVRNCTINEVSTWVEKLCLACSEASYNFDLSREEVCMPCPENANCLTRYIKPNDGYWHKSPCHSKVKKCIVEKACKYQNRTKRISNFSQDCTKCQFNGTNLKEYGEIQCHNVSILASCSMCS